MSKIKVLNLYDGIGGNRKLWKNVDVTAIERHDNLLEEYCQLNVEYVKLRKELLE